MKERNFLLKGGSVVYKTEPVYLWLTEDLLDLCWCKGSSPNLDLAESNSTIVEISTILSSRSTNEGQTLTISLSGAVTFEFEATEADKWSNNIDQLLNGKLSYSLLWNIQDVGAEIALFYKLDAKWLQCTITGYDETSNQHKIKMDHKETLYDLSKVVYRVELLPSTMALTEVVPVVDTTASNTTSNTTTTSTTTPTTNPSNTTSTMTPSIQLSSTMTPSIPLSPTSSPFNNTFLLRSFHQNDIDDIVKACNDLEFAKKLARIPHPYTKESAQYFLDHICTSEIEHVYAIEVHGSVVGAVSLTYSSATSVLPEPMLGIWIGKEYWRKGYGRKALEILLSNAFHCHVDAIVAEVFDDNLASMSLLCNAFSFKAVRHSNTGTSMARSKEEIHIPVTHLRLTKKEWNTKVKVQEFSESTSTTSTTSTSLSLSASSSTSFCPAHLLIFLTVFIALSSWLTFSISTSLAETNPKLGYMDEIFHIPQTQKYCTHLSTAWKEEVKQPARIEKKSSWFGSSGGGDDDVEKTIVAYTLSEKCTRYIHRLQNIWQVSYDDKITTPPGLYIMSSILLTLIPTGLVSGGNGGGEGGGNELCSPMALRSMNILFQTGTVIIIYNILKILMNRLKHSNTSSSSASSSSTLLWTIVLVTSPVHFFCGLLYYTDAASTCLTLLLYLLTLREIEHDIENVNENETDSEWDERHSFSSSLYRGVKCQLVFFVGVLALACRQNNVVWSAFCIGTLLVHHLQLNYHRHRLSEILHDNANDDSKRPNLFFQDEIYSLYLFCTSPFRLIQFIINPIVIGNLWVIFVFIYCWIQNDYAVVLGDRSNHVPVIHTSQLLYFVLFVATVLSTEWISMSKYGILHLLKSRKFNKKENQNIHTINVARSWTLWMKKMLFFVVVPICIGLSIRFASPVHPFMLADNRHYVFYLWKKIMSKKYVRYGLLPIYLVFGWILCKRLKNRNSNLWCVGLLMCTCMVLVPAHLVEFRYFTVPAFLWQLHVVGGGSSGGSGSCSWWKSSGMVTLMIHLLINFVIVWIFIKKTFEAPDGSVGRFMF